MDSVESESESKSESGLIDDLRGRKEGQRAFYSLCFSTVLSLLVVPDGMYTRYVHTTQSTESNGGDWKK